MTPEIVEALIEGLRNGVPILPLLDIVLRGNRDKYYVWLRHGTAHLASGHPDTPYAQFVTRVRLAVAEHERELAAQVQRAATETRTETTTTTREEVVKTRSGYQV